MQFGTMLILVRLLTPEDYGQVALAQSIIGLISVFSFQTFVSHALQVRNPDTIDWQSHFTAGFVINTLLFLVTLVVAWLLSLTDQYARVAYPLVGMGFVLLVEILATLRYRMLESRHEWKQFRLLTIYGALLGSVGGILVAIAGGGYWALVVQVPLFMLPAAVDLLHKGKWRARWHFSWATYRAAFHFGSQRMGSSLATRGRQTVEQSVLAATYAYTDLGVFTRTIGLGTLLIGRIGGIFAQMLYPVITRVEPSSQRFREIARKVFGTVLLVTVPMACFLAWEAEAVVDLLYGDQWHAVAGLLPLGVASVAVSGLSGVVNSLLLANEQVRYCFLLDLASAVSGVVLVFWLLPLGVELYLFGLVIHGLVFLGATLVLLARTKGITIGAVFPLGLKVTGGGLVAIGLIAWLPSTGLFEVVDLLGRLLVFVMGTFVVFRLLVPEMMREMLLVLPGGEVLAKLVRVR